MSVLERLLRARSPVRSGQADALTAHATGITPGLLDAAATGDAAPEIAPDVAATAGRRGRGLDRAEDVLKDGLAQKVLGFWLQNRHQTLFSLTVNFRTLDPEAAALLAQWSAAALLAAAPADRDAPGAARSWLAGAGADPAALDAFDAALVSPPSLDALLAAIAAHRSLSATAYVAALVALGQRDPAARFFLEFVAARLGLPSTVIRSANRRFGR